MLYIISGFRMVSLNHEYVDPQCMMFPASCLLILAEFTFHEMALMNGGAMVSIETISPKRTIPAYIDLLSSGAFATVSAKSKLPAR